MHWKWTDAWPVVRLSSAFSNKTGAQYHRRLSFASQLFPTYLQTNKKIPYKTFFSRVRFFYLDFSKTLTFFHPSLCRLITRGEAISCERTQDWKWIYNLCVRLYQTTNENTYKNHLVDSECFLSEATNFKDSSNCSPFSDSFILDFRTFYGCALKANRFSFGFDQR